MFEERFNNSFLGFEVGKALRGGGKAKGRKEEKRLEIERRKMKEGKVLKEEQKNDREGEDDGEFVDLVVG